VAAQAAEQAANLKSKQDAKQLAEKTEYGFEATLEAALAHDPQLKSAYWRHQANKEEASFGMSRLLPDIRLSATYQYENSDNIYTDDDPNNSFFSAENERSSGELDDHYWRVSVRQPLVNYSAHQDYKKGKAVVKASKYNYQKSEQELIYRVSAQYLQVILSTQQVYLNQQKLDALELKKSQATRAHELGVGDRLRVLYVNSARDLARTSLLEAESHLIDAQTLLSNLTGFNVKIPKQWGKSSNTIMPSLLADTQEEWLKRIDDNYNIKEAGARILRDKHNLASSKAEHYPTLHLNLSHLDRKSEDDFRTRKDAIAAIELNVPLYTGGQTQAKVRQARAQLHASEAELEHTKAEKEQQIKLSYNRLVSFKERLLALAESRDSGQGYLEAAERQLSLNISDQINVSDARSQLIDTQLQIAQTLNDYLLSDLILRLETGRLNKAHLKEYDNLFNSAAK